MRTERHFGLYHPGGVAEFQHGFLAHARKDIRTYTTMYSKVKTTSSGGLAYSV